MKNALRNLTCAVLLLASSAIVAAPASLPASKPSSSPAANAPYPLYGELYEKTKAVLAEGSDAKPLIAQIDEQIKPVVTSKAKDKAARLEQLFTLRGALENFEKSTDRDMTAYLLDRPTVLARFLHAMMGEVTVPNVPKAIAVLNKLRQFDPKRFEKYPEFCIAFAIVWHDYSPYYWVKTKNGPVKPEQMMEIYKYFIDNESKMQITPWTLPHELSMYVVGIPVSAAERDWVLRTYGGRISAKDVYPTVPWTKKLSPAHGTGDGIDYTLMNMRKLGGVCMEQAYFSEQVLRLRGVPAVYMEGGGLRGGHAWCGEFKPGEKSWDFTAGRYRYDRYYNGDATDPGNSERKLAEEPIAMTAAVFAAGPALLPKIERSKFLVDAACWTGHLPDVIEGDKPMTRVEMMLSLVSEAIEADPFNYVAWGVVIVACQRNMLTNEQAITWSKKAYDVLQKDFPAFAIKCVSEYSKDVTDVEFKIQVFDKLFTTLSKSRPDLAASVKVAQGDVYMQKDDVKTAIQCYVYPMVKFSKDDHILGLAKERLEKVDEKADEKKVEEACADTVKLLFAVPKRTPEQIEASDILLKKLVAIYEKRGDTEKADKFRKSLSKPVAVSQ